MKEIEDGENYVEGTSVTTLEGYEPLESIVARCTRIVTSPNGNSYNVLDTDALKAEETQTGIYEASEAQTLDEAFATMDPTDAQGYDLADASQDLNVANAKVAESLSNLSPKGTNTAPSNSGVSDVVDKSNLSDTTDAKDGDFPEKG